MNQKRRTAHDIKVPLKYLFEGGGGGMRLNLLPNFQKGRSWQDLNL